MAQESVTPDVYWIFNQATKAVEIVSDGKVLETTTLAQAAKRLAHHRHELAKARGQTFVASRARKRGRA